MYVLLPSTESLAVLLPGMVVAGLGQGVAFTTLYLAAGTGVSAGEQGVASAVASTAQQLGASIGLAGLVALLSWRAAALGGHGSALTGASPDVLTGALHSVFAAQAGIALLGAGVALVVIGNRRRRRHRGPAVGGRAAEATEPAVAVAGVDVLITMLTDGAAVERVMTGPGGALSALRPGRCGCR